MNRVKAEHLGFLETWWAATFTPRAFFSRPARTRSRVGPVWFAMIVAAPTGFGTGLVGALLQGLPAAKALGSAIAWLFILPLLRLIGVSTAAAFLQFWLMIARVKPRPFRETLECVGYSTGPSVLGVVPVVGVLLGSAWELVVLGLGLRTAHKTSRGKAIFAILGGNLQGPFKVAPGETWVMGDDRNNSHDSRSWRGGLGAGVPFENIKGRVMFVWMSFGPSGGIAQDRLFVDVLGAPTIPGAQAGPLGAALEKCLRERPERARTTPPAPGASAPSGP